MFKDRRKISPVTRFFRCLRSRPIIVVLAVVLCLVHITALRAQERLRTAAGRLQIESFKNPEAFFPVGPLQAVLIASSAFAFTANSALSHTVKLSLLPSFH